MKLTIIHTSDVHGSINGYQNIFNYVSKLEGNVMKIDSGDAIQGSPEMIFYKNNQKRFDNPIINTFNQIGYDYFVPGNHDFNYGLKYLRNFTNNIHAKTICLNVIQGKSLYFDLSHDLKNIEGRQILTIGFTNHYVPYWEKKETIQNLSFINPSQDYNLYISNLKERYKPDLVIVAYHGGFNCDNDYQIIKNGSKENVGCELLTPDVDILLTSHEHRLFVKKYNNQWISQPGYKGEHLIQFDVEFNDNYKQIEAKIINLKDFNLSRDFLNLDEFKIAKEMFLNQVIAKNSGPTLEFKDPVTDRIVKPAIAQLFNEIQMELTKADISICSFPNDILGLSDEITIREVLETYVFSNTLFLCKISGHILKEALIENAQFFTFNGQDIVVNKQFEIPKKMYFQYDFYEGIEYKIIVHSTQNNEVVDLTFKGKPIDEDMTFLITMNSYRFMGGGYQTWQKELEIVREFPIDVSEMITEYLVRKHTINVNYKNNIKVVKGKNS